MSRDQAFYWAEMLGRTITGVATAIIAAAIVWGASALSQLQEEQSKTNTDIQWIKEAVKSGYAASDADAEHARLRKGIEENTDSIEALEGRILDLERSRFSR